MSQILLMRYYLKWCIKMTDSDFEWVDFFNLANSLIKDADEAKQRTSISRYYYSAFCESRDSLIKNKRFKI